MAVKICLVWPFLTLCAGFASANGIAMAGQMQANGLPNNLLLALDPVAVIIFGVFVEKWLYPFCERRKIRFENIKRITVGLLFMAFTMAYGTMTQALVYRAAPCYDFPLECSASNGGSIPNEVNILIQLPLYALLAVSHILAFVTGMAYTYKKAPKNMKSMLQSFMALMWGVGYGFGAAVSPAARNPHLVNVWTGLTSAMGLATIAFWFSFRQYDRRDSTR
jgi:POT family proton-dependent oligopeptide transporter